MKRRRRTFLWIGLCVAICLVIGVFRYRFEQAALRNAMRQAIESKAPNVVAELLDSGADPNQRIPPDVITFRSEDLNVPVTPVQRLKEHFFPHRWQDGGGPILVFAVSYQNPRIVELLLQHGADVNAADDHGATALVNVSDIESLRILLKAGADPNKGDKRKRFPINEVPYLVPDSDGPIAVRLLRDAGANLSVRDVEGRSVQEVARLRGRKDLLAALEAP